MAFIKRNYTDNVTVITAENLNDIQDEVLRIGDALDSVEGTVAKSVLYTAQSLTDVQKAQARANIGAASDTVFIATQQTTYAEVQEQYRSLKAVFFLDDELWVYPLAYYDGVKFVFANVDGERQRIVRYAIRNDGNGFVYEGAALTENAVLYTSQTLTEEQKAQARANIGVGEGTGERFDPTAYGLPILELTGDTSTMTKDNEVSLGYVYGDRNGTCTMKWQGSSSLNYPKKNYTIKFDNAFEAFEGWGVQKKYCLKANFMECTHARNIVTAKLWGQMVKTRQTDITELESLPNGGAIDGFPIIITLNGEFHGLYTFNIPKDGWMFGMGSGTQEAIVCADNHCDATKFKTAATLDGDFELEYATDEDNADWVLTSLNRLINAVINSNGSDLDTTVAQYLDWKSAIDYYILVVLTCGWDLVDYNYLLTTYDGVKWFFSAYDMDSILGLDVGGKGFVSPTEHYLTAEYYASMHRVMWLISQRKTHELKERYKQIRASAMSNGNLFREFMNFTAGIPSVVFDEDVRKWPTIPNSKANTIPALLEWYRQRVIAIDAEVEAMTGIVNLFTYGEDGTAYLNQEGVRQVAGALNLTIVPGSVVGYDPDDGSKIMYRDILFENNGGTYTFGATFTALNDGTFDPSGRTVSPRRMLQLFDANGNIITDEDIPNGFFGAENWWSYLDYYKGYWTDFNGELTFKLPENVASFRIGFRWAHNPSMVAPIGISNIYLYSGV